MEVDAAQVDVFDVIKGGCGCDSLERRRLDVVFPLAGFVNTGGPRTMLVGLLVAPLPRRRRIEGTRMNSVGTFE